ncbi:MAG: hypothetical protein WA776_07785 [Xanthobacteraceae bacterium]
MDMDIAAVTANPVTNIGAPAGIAVTAASAALVLADATAAVAEAR